VRDGLEDVLGRSGVQAQGDEGPPAVVVTPLPQKPRNGEWQSKVTTCRRDAATFGSAMPTCIYCLEEKGPPGFSKVEHVLPKSFGAFRENLTLHEMVCDECNAYFSKELELYLARDTPDGLNRFLIGGKDAQEFKSLGRRSSLVHRADDGPLKGALVAHRVSEGLLEMAPLPQVAFGKQDGGPYEKWFTVDALPERETIHALVRDGYVYVHLCEITDAEPILAELRARGAQVSDLYESRPAGWRSAVRVETSAQLGMTFGRAITKISLNYLAHEYGGGVAMMAAFNTARRFARYGGKREEERIWDRLSSLQGERPLGHYVEIRWDRRNAQAIAEVSFHNAARYLIRLGTELLVVPTNDRAHFFDLASMTARRVR
jgi:hypothetical protein